MADGTKPIRRDRSAEGRTGDEGDADHHGECIDQIGQRAAAGCLGPPADKTVGVVGHNCLSRSISRRFRFADGMCRGRREPRIDRNDYNIITISHFLQFVYQFLFLQCLQESSFFHY